MKFKISLMLCALFFTVVQINAASTNEKIKNQEKDLASSKKIEAGLNKKLDDIANDIKRSETELENINKDIVVLKQQIDELKQSKEQAQNDLNELNRQNNELITNQKQVEASLVNIIAQNFSLDLLMADSEGESAENIISIKAVEKLNSIMKDDLRKLAKNYDETTNIIRQKQERIETIQKSLSDFESKKAQLLKLQKKQNDTVIALKNDNETYKKKLINLKNQQEQMRQTLQKLSIIAQKENEQKSQKQTQKSQNIAQGKPQQGYSGTAVRRYTGAKTIAPLDSFSIKQRFGNYVDPIYNLKIFNESVILSSNTKDATVKNVLDGKVIFAKHTALLDNVIIIENSAQIHTVYANLSQIAPSVKVGAVVKKGSIIGRVSQDLTFEVTQKNYHIDPLELIAIK
ncbi:murein hydrolase activator EnvC [Campylobacter sp. 19-13652]|uniref:murein hydrolase activator EnvC family protein n=1 Tax=Campylobacter sp. 19-13652 TaxID=2840180 RepID=UPI001C796DBD|nr:peptidoglycan DD-metalloendopeptidase family protein [Campylobacter sp. 19-13652]BCX79749.1 peptidase M23 [Campylobacter sp. 19-13652]